MKPKQSRYKYYGAILLMLPYVVWFLLGADSFVLIHDNLDSEFVYIKLLLNSGDLFGLNMQGQIDAIMNGLDRSFLRSGLSFTFLIFKLFPPIYAYIIHHFIVHLIGYIGMYLLLRKYFIKDREALVVAISVLFGLVAYYHVQYGISISGQPLLLYAFLNLLNGSKKWSDWVVVALFPFFSFLAVTLPFYVPILGLIGLIYAFRHRKIPYAYFTALALLCLINVLVEFNLIAATFFSEHVSHRTEWEKLQITGKPTFSVVMNAIMEGLKQTHYHAGYVSARLVLIALLLGILFRIRLNRSLKLILAINLGIVIWVALNRPIILWFGKTLGMLNVFQFDRFYFLLPFLWLLLFALILNAFRWEQWIQKGVAIALLAAMSWLILSENQEYKVNAQMLCSEVEDKPTFRQFYDADLFEEIRVFLGEETMNADRFLNIGIFPSIAQYHGFKTLDSYQNNYDLSYKHEFRKIIASELEKNEAIRKGFDYWGSRCYLYSAELGSKFTIGKNTELEIENLDIDLEQIKKMNGKYILSTVVIEKNTKEGLKYLRSFANDDSYWQIHLYEVL